MWSVERPDLDSGETFSICISRVRNPEMRRKLNAIRSLVEHAAEEYSVKAENRELHLIQQLDPIGEVPGSEMVRTYERRMVPKDKPGRPIYDQIKLLPKGGKCPYCNQRNVSTLDHVLPKQNYPIFAVTPDNLVGSCRDCNDLKLDTIPTSASDTMLHPYFDQLNEHQWLFGEVLDKEPPVVTFFVLPVDEWGDELNSRIAHQFETLKLGKLYSNQAASEIADIRYNLNTHFDSGGVDAVRIELQRQWKSRQNNHINSWKTATYEAMSQSDWFCEGGFNKFGY